MKGMKTLVQMVAATTASVADIQTLQQLEIILLSIIKADLAPPEEPVQVSLSHSLNVF